VGLGELRLDPDNIGNQHAERKCSRETNWNDHIAAGGNLSGRGCPKWRHGKESLSVEQSLSQAFLQGDWKTVERLYADDLVFTNADGSVTHKLGDVNNLRSGDVKFESIDTQDMQVQDFGDIAVVTGKLVEKGRYKTVDLSGTYRFTDVWAKRNGRWQLVASQETLYTPAK
jgi:ketosteroid isomerase-like protein